MNGPRIVRAKCSGCGEPMDGPSERKCGACRDETTAAIRAKMDAVPRRLLGDPVTRERVRSFLCDGDSLTRRYVREHFLAGFASGPKRPAVPRRSHGA